MTTETNPTTADELPVAMATNQAAFWLSTQTELKTSKQWVVWLHNNRANARKSGWRMPCEKYGNRILYDTADLFRLVRVSEVAAGRAKITPEDAAWLKSLSTKDQPET